LNAGDAQALDSCLLGGGVAVIPTDTVYGLACDARDERALRRMHELKGRVQAKPAAVMFCSLEAAEPALAHVGPRTRGAVERLLPGPLTLLLPPHHGDEALGLRVPRLGGGLTPLRAVRTGMLQTSANLTGGEDPRRVSDIPRSIRDGVDLVLDGGELPGVPSTIVDLRDYEREGRWEVLREAAMARDQLERALSSPGP
jgi:L-threonylcarbamoyladenylate synthase